MLKIAFAFLGIAVLAGLFGFGVIPSPYLDEFRLVFFAFGTLFVPALLVALVRIEDEHGSNE
jgi:hypothetical protein